MVASPVEAVWVWYYDGSTQKWTYGRYGNQDGFTKDHLQIKDRAGEVISAAYGLRPVDGEKHDLTLTWPGGSVTGRFIFTGGRFTLRWDRNADREGPAVPWSAPDPWRMTPAPDETSAGPLRGNGEAATVTGAAAALSEFNATETNAYLVAVKLKGNAELLHVRTYIDQPSADLSFASTALLPAPIRALVTKLGTKPTCEAVTLDSSGALVEPEVAEVVARLEENPNLLLIGPPGTGKSVLLDKLARHVADPGRGVFFDPEERYDAWSEPVDAALPGMAVTVVLHPSYSYDNLVVGLLPEAADGGVTVGAATGPLVNLAHYASNGENRALLVLDEFNRGNAAAILGDTLALLDKDKRGVASVELPTYGLELHVPDEFAVDGQSQVGSRFTLPAGLWIVAAMNSSDRSVAPLDAALRRRFSIVEIGPGYDVLGLQLAADDSANLADEWSDWTPGAVSKLAVALLHALNDRIEAALGRDFLLGHSNLWHVGGSTAESVLRSLARAWDERIVQTLRLALQDDDDALAFILMAGRTTDAGLVSPGRAAWWKKADPTFEQFARPRLQFELLAEVTDSEALLAELKRLSGI